MQEEGPDGEGAPHDGVTRYQRDTERETTQDTGESYTITHPLPTIIPLPTITPQLLFIVPMAMQCYEYCCLIVYGSHGNDCFPYIGTGEGNGVDPQDT